MYYMSRPDEDENPFPRTRTPSLSRVRVSGVRDPGYRATRKAPSADQSVHESLLSKDMGMFDERDFSFIFSNVCLDPIDESTLISISSFNVNDYTNRKSHPRFPPKYYVDRQHVRLPPIDRPQRDPSVHHYVQSERRPDNVHHSQSIPQRYRSLNHYRPRQYRHGDTYDPRWWYMPINSVHGPKSRRWIDHRQHHYYYSPPKWYQLPDRR